MPKSLRPRPGRSAGPKRVVSTLPKDVLAELRSTAKIGRADLAIARLDRAVELLERDDSAGAASEALKAKDLAPRSGAVREIAALALYRQGRFREALVEAQSYRRLTGRADQNHIIADCYRATGQPERAVPLAEEALRSQRVPLAARVESVIVAASALADLGRFDQALGLLRRVKTREDVGGPEVLRVWYVTADILERSGRRDDAELEFRKILRHDARAYDVAERIAALASGGSARSAARVLPPPSPAPERSASRSPRGRGSAGGARAGVDRSGGRGGVGRSAGAADRSRTAERGGAKRTATASRTGRQGRSVAGSGDRRGSSSTAGASKGRAVGRSSRSDGRGAPASGAADAGRAVPKKGAASSKGARTGSAGGSSRQGASGSRGGRSPRRSR